MYKYVALISFPIFLSIGCTHNAPDLGSGDGGPSTDGGGTSMTSPCVSPIQPADVSNPTTVVGTGAASSCTEQALEQAVARGGIITFNCGGAATIRITSQKQLRTDIDTVIDGRGVITLDGGGHTRLFYFQGPNYRITTTKVTFQNITLINGQATGTPIPEVHAEAANCSRRFHLDGGGAANIEGDG